MIIYILNKIFPIFLVQERGVRLTYFIESITDTEVNDISFSEYSCKNLPGERKFNRSFGLLFKNVCISLASCTLFKYFP